MRRAASEIAATAMACLWLLAPTGGCEDQPAPTPLRRPTTQPSSAAPARPAPAREPALGRRPRAYKVVHVFVALCDNRHQGIVPVPAALGNGQDPPNNLYWGALYGVKTFFRRSPSWSLVPHRSAPADPAVLERVVFRGTWGGQAVYVIADAYDGAKMARVLQAFLRAAAGHEAVEVTVDGASAGRPLQSGALADLVCFVGHNGLMDVSLGDPPGHIDGPNPHGAIVLACKSLSYFRDPLRRAGCPLLLATTGLMAPEAYTLDAALRSWAAGQSPGQVRHKAAAVYAKYQHCSTTAALRLFTSGS